MQQFSTSSLGGYLAQPYLTQKLRSVAQPMFRFRQFVDVKEAIGRNRGDTWLFDKVSNVATQGGTLVKISANLLTVMSEICYACNEGITNIQLIGWKLLKPISTTKVIMIWMKQWTISSEEWNLIYNG